MDVVDSMPLIRLDESEISENQAYTIIFIVAAAIVAIIAGGVAMICVARGGNLEWTTKFWVFVKVACRFN
jgi:hypothetical protein